MKSAHTFLPGAFSLLLCTGALAQSNAAQTRQFEWQTATPESEGMSSAKLEALKARLASKKTKAFLVIRNDRIVYEWYGDGHSATNRHGTASLAKAVVGGLSLAVAMTDGRISLDDPASKFVPQWKSEPNKSKITVRQLGSHTSGLADAEEDGKPHEQLAGWKGDFWKRLNPPDDPFTIARDRTPMIFKPGEKFQYSNPGIAMMTYCVTAAIGEGAHKDVRTLLRERVMHPIGVADAEWSAGYGKTDTVDDLPLVGSWGGGAYTARAMARLGRLVLREGDWDGRRILSRESVHAVTRDAGLPGDCGMGWWGNGGARYAGLPKDAIWGAGAGDQLLLVVPSLSLIMVRNGQTLEPGPGEPPVRQDDVFTKYHDYRARILFEPLVEAIVDKGRSALVAPYPPSKVITGIEWAPKETIRRAAKGSDNWPVTWADDDALYGAYGDGNGFEPFTPQKLSMGFARITGGASNFRGENLRSASGETLGQGAAGRKASGLLSVQGILYLWTRNATNAQLAWSSDHGATWSWADWRFTESFGCPTFVNFGRDYAGARDGHVYVCSPDHGSAYERADRFVLASVPKDRIRDRAAYEFFGRVDENGQPIWSREIGTRGAAFSFPGGCYRPGITFNPSLQRYLLVQALPGAGSKDQAGKVDTRFSGGLAVFDAPELWGPWTTAFFAREWDAGPGDSASFPPKWMSDDGREVHLVFAGDDSFSVRAAKLTTAETAGSGTASTSYFPPPESQGGWRTLDNPEEIRRLGGMDPDKLSALKDWLLQSDKRNFAAVVIRNGYVVLEVERGNSAKTDSRRVASVSKAVCATVLAIASERSQRGLTPRKMKFDDPAFDFIPWAQPLSDPRKAGITVKQLLNHTSGLCPEATGARNDGSWEYIFGHTGDARTEKLAFDPGTACGYSSHALHHASLVCETVTGKPYDQFAIEALFKPVGVEHWWFQYYDGGEKIGRHPSHGLGMPARDLARIAYCMLRGGRWQNQQVVPRWFAEETGAPTHSVKTREMRFKRDAESFSHAWELPGRLTGEGGNGAGIPRDARYKPGSGGQLIAFVPSLDLVITRQTGSSGQWEYEDYLRRACAATP